MSTTWGFSITLSDERQPNGQRCGQIAFGNSVGDVTNWRQGGDPLHILFEVTAVRGSDLDMLIRGKLGHEG
jgi:hypothetical protein